MTIPNRFASEGSDLLSFNEAKLLDPMPSYLATTIKWMEEFVAQPHPDLGRKGVVCPFVPRSLELNSIWFFIREESDLTQDRIESIARSHREPFMELEPSLGNDALNKTIVLLFPNLNPSIAPNLIDTVHRKFKPYYVEKGLMLGEFHAENKSRGLHNAAFMPLKSPFPMLVIRYMVQTDLPFLIDANHTPEMRISFLESYIENLKPILSLQNLAFAVQLLELAHRDPERLLDYSGMPIREY